MANNYDNSRDPVKTEIMEQERMLGILKVGDHVMVNQPYLDWYEENNKLPSLAKKGRIGTIDSINLSDNKIGIVCDGAGQTLNGVPILLALYMKSDYRLNQITYIGQELEKIETLITELGIEFGTFKLGPNTQKALFRPAIK